MLQWASKNFDEAEISRYDKVMESGIPDAAYFAVQALAAKYNDGVGEMDRCLQVNQLSLMEINFVVKLKL